jgi:putative membrane protein
MNRFLCGVLGGTVATVPMTIVMQVLHHWPTREREELPPEQITEYLTEQAETQMGVDSHLGKPQIEALTLVNHFGFGGAMGGIYVLLSPRIPANSVFKGALWGLMVWTVSYLGWLPAAHILEPATQTPRRRNFLMIVAHLVWGVVTALATDRLASENAS